MSPRVLSLPQLLQALGIRARGRPRHCRPKCTRPTKPIRIDATRTKLFGGDRALDVAGALLAEMHLIVDRLRLSLKLALIGKKDGKTALDEALTASHQLYAFACATIEHLSQLNRLRLLPQQERLLDDLLVQYRRILVGASPAFMRDLRCEFEEGCARSSADAIEFLHARDETEYMLRVLWAAFVSLTGASDGARAITSSPI